MSVQSETPTFDQVNDALNTLEHEHNAFWCHGQAVCQQNCSGNWPCASARAALVTLFKADDDGAALMLWATRYLG